ncbi:two-component sensor histidine kinase [Virgisporangium aliadipatigenens]|uniref:histidine kinase n=1 Tax=Virgisporangium aliadipatigenens TaxID=741659 RepID=A0A8J4DRF0_9ACTN|nr:HAMP domain-containing sensor histidine kinase [Virgisporangium aliadipatigenens]GIJ47589.1 two-component sensor histidine kinase [Virgisporangium aliadipatigenens]
MRQRLAASYVLLLVLVLAALEVPLALVITIRDSERVALDRLADAARFASSAESAITNGDDGSLRSELERYDQIYGIAVALLDRQRAVLIYTRDDRLPTADPEVKSQVDRALAGEQTTGSGTVWPWQDRPLVVAAPVGNGGETTGAIVIISPTGELRADTAVSYLTLAAGGLLALVTFVVAALALARWTLKPVAELDTAVHTIAGGDYAARVPPDRGPPELRHLATAFNEMVGTVSDVLERQRAFVSQASHQLRNPLTALRLRVENLAEDAEGDEGRLVLQETDRLSAILDSLLELASAERGRFGLERVDPDAVAADRVAAWRPLADQRGATLRHEPSGRALKVQAVTTAVDQSLDALIDNAVKFGATTVTVRVRPDGDGVAVHVVDDGPGLTEEQRRLATERFWRAPTTQNTAGSGLGLPIVAVLVDTSGGRLELGPAEPHGLDAMLWFPKA